MSKRMTKRELRAYHKGMKDQLERDAGRLHLLTIDVFRGDVAAPPGMADFAERLAKGLGEALLAIGPGRAKGEPEVKP